MLLLLLPVAGCAVAGVAASIVPQPPVAAAYGGLKNQRVAIMVWTDGATEADHPSIEADVAKAIGGKLQEAADAGAGDVKHIQWVGADRILQFQEDHPEMESDAAEEVALKLPVPVTRLIYVEIASFSLHSDQAVDLTRGTATANIKVVEVAGNKATVPYEEDNISVVYPPDAPPEGLPGLDDDYVYQQSIDALSSAVAKRFVSHDANEE
jgi:hypothetical protein